MAWSKALEKGVIRVRVGRVRGTRIIGSTVINSAKPGIGSQKLGAFGTNRSQSLGLGRYIYTFGFLFTSGIDDLLRAI